jgi:uncharacterized protein (TIGR03083 family)
MALPRQEVVDGTTAELASFEELIRSLSDEEWNTPTRCEGWTVADVCSHVTGTWANIANGTLDKLTVPNAPQLEADERKGRSPGEVADELHGAVKVAIDIAATFDDAAWAGSPPVDVPGTLGEAVEGLWYDAYVHGEDVRAALGRLSVRGPGLRASVSHLADLLTLDGWGPATLALNGIEEFPVSGGGGKAVTGDALTFVLIATGREDPSLLDLDDTVNVYRET